jgi:hypothetical protein
VTDLRYGSVSEEHQQREREHQKDLEHECKSVLAVLFSVIVIDYQTVWLITAISFD